jgi:hypothetical protein
MKVIQKTTVRKNKNYNLLAIKIAHQILTPDSSQTELTKK